MEERLHALRSETSSVNHARLVSRRREAELAARQGLSRSSRRLRTFESLLADAQRFARAREEQVPSFTRPWPVLRAAVQRLGKDLVADGAIAEADDVFFLTRDEVVAGVQRGPGPTCETRRPRDAQPTVERAVWSRR